MTDSTQEVAALNGQFALAGQLDFAANDNGMVLARITNAHARAVIALQGAHVMTFQPQGEPHPVIWMSPVANLVRGKSLRGGVPVCWPWFGAHASESSFPAHGFARTVLWQVKATEALADGRTRITLALPPSSIPSAQWSPACQAQLVVTVGRELEIELMTHNGGMQPIEIGEALHTYFAVSNAEQIRIAGLDGASYLDKADDWQRKVQEGEVQIAGEVDRLYINTESMCDIVDAAWQRRIRIKKRNSRSTVVWNPGPEKAAKMGDFGSETGYLDMVCVESANAGENRVQVLPGASHTLTVSYSVQPL